VNVSIATPPHSRNAISPALVMSAAGLLGVIALTVVLIAVGAFGTPAHTSVVQPSFRASAAGPGLDAAAIYAQVNPGVVDITAHSTSSSGPGSLAQPGTTASTDTGTGMVIDARGDILTADHVVAGAQSVTVAFQGGATRSATVLGSDAATDIAVLRVATSGLALHPLTLGTLSGHRVGDPIAVLGDPFDVQRSLSAGIISGLDRTISALNGYSIPHAVQTDAAMNPGNSGGPVLDAGGRVIGIADQIETGGGGADSSTGVGFAVSIDVVNTELSELKAGRTPAHADLGVGAGDASNSEGDTGALVGSVQPRGPAADAGVRPGDLIVALGGAKITGVNDLIATTAKYQPGDRVVMTVVRQGKRRSFAITFAKQPTRAVAG
jgi:S1-C subfamily serine protease